MQKWDSICIDGKHWKAPRRNQDFDRMNNRRRKRGHRDRRFVVNGTPVLILVLAALPGIVLLALGLW